VSDSSVAPGETITVRAQPFVGEVTFTLFSEPAVLGTATDGVGDRPSHRIRRG
jgi:hypothetical protein